jgi:TonB family protein
MTRDPNELMLLAAKVNGLTADNVRPWHLKATYKLLDEKGNTTGQGVYEEFWVSPTKFKRTFTDSTFTVTDYGTEKGVLRSGKQSGPPYLVSEVRRKFVEPMQSLEVVGIESYDLVQRGAGKTTLACLSMKDASGARFGPTWCLDSDRPILRISATPQGFQMLRSSVVSFQGRFIAKDFALNQSGKAVLSAHLDSIEPILAIDDALFLAPGDASPATPEGFPPSAVTEGFVIAKVEPSYPDIAKGNFAKGTVVLKAIVGRDGHLRNLAVASGPKLLQQAALDAAKKWVYRPYLLNNDPVEVMSTINIKF